MAKEDIIGITVNGENVANFSIPSLGHKVRLNEYQFTRVGELLEVSIALIKKENGFASSEEKETQPLHTEPVVHAPIIPVAPEPQKEEIVPLAVPEKKMRKPRTPKTKESDEVVAPQPKEEARAEDPKPVVESAAVKDNLNTPVRVAEIAKLIKFYCKSAGITTGDITIERLKTDAIDIVEFDDDATIQAAIIESRR